MHIRDWPEHERPRERLLRLGADSLSDAELLAIFIGSGTRGCSAVELGRELLGSQGGLRGLLDLSATELRRCHGLGTARACRLNAALALAQRHLGAQLERGEALRDPRAAGRYFAARLRHLEHEVFACLFLDNQHRVLAFETLAQGTFDGAEVHAREVLKRALAHNAAAVLLAHNHPSGNREPSAADRALTQRLQQALGLVEVRVLDHLIIGDGAPVSMAELGLI